MLSFFFFLKQDLKISGFPIVWGHRGGQVPPSHHHCFFGNHPTPNQSQCPWWGGPPHRLKNEDPLLKSKALFKEMIRRKKKKSNCHCVSLIKKWETFLKNGPASRKKTLEKHGRNSPKMWFSHLEHLKFHKKSETVC